MGVTVKKCHMIMSGNDCWNSVCFSCCRKADNELADVTLSGRLFQNLVATTGQVEQSEIFGVLARLASSTTHAKCNKKGTTSYSMSRRTCIH